jgi:heme A synthase
VTALVVFLQLLLGGLLTFGFIDPTPHIINGFIVFGLAIVTLLLSLVSKPSFRPIQGIASGMVALILVQIVLGFATLSSGNQILAWVHFAVATAIYGMAVAGTFLAMRWDQMTTHLRDHA